jgi:hypothetical protein
LRTDVQKASRFPASGSCRQRRGHYLSNRLARAGSPSGRGAGIRTGPPPRATTAN